MLAQLFWIVAALLPVSIYFVVWNNGGVARLVKASLQLCLAALTLMWAYVTWIAYMHQDE